MEGGWQSVTTVYNISSEIRVPETVRTYERQRGVGKRTTRKETLPRERNFERKNRRHGDLIRLREE